MWPPATILMILLTFVIVAMIIAGLFHYRFDAALWNFVFEPSQSPTHIAGGRIDNA